MMNVVKLLLASIGIVCKMGVIVSSYYVKRARAIHAFRKQLNRLHIDRNTVEMLSQEYRDMLDIHKLIGQYSRPHVANKSNSRRVNSEERVG